jgi:hypothetical protein
MSMNLEIIQAIAMGKERYLSTSQACMCALALCRPDLLQQDGYTVAEAWQRIDEGQLRAILEFNGAIRLIGAERGKA